MNLFAGKTKQERNKIIAAGVLGVLAIFALFLAFGPTLRSGTAVAVSVSTTPKPTASVKAAPPNNFDVPTQEQQSFDYITTPVVYTGGNAYAPDTGRNIFAFYEPPPPCRGCPTPIAPIAVKTPTPAPPPPIILASLNPQSVYAGTGAFRLEVNGDKFEPSMHIYFNQSEIPTNFVSAQRLTADIPANFIAGEGSRQVIVQTPDGKKYSNQFLLSVQAPPKPQFQYVGMISRKRYNNDTAYFQEQGKQTPTGARLNDVVGGRFRLVSISAAEAVFQDVDLGFKHRVLLYRPAPGTASTGSPNDGTYVPPFNPNFPNYQPPQNIPRYVPPNPPRTPEKTPDDADDNDN